MMARKKRLDRKRDKSSGQRIAQLGKAALVVGTGAALFGRARLDKSILGDFIPAVSKTIDDINVDLLGKKKNALEIHEAIERRIGKNGKNFKKTLLEQKSRKYHARQDVADNIIGKRRAVDQSTNVKIYKKADRQLEEDVKAKVLQQALDAYKDKYTKDQITQIVDGTLGNIDYVKEAVSKNDLDLSFLEKTVQALEMKETDARTIIKTTAKSYSAGYNDVTKRKNREQYAKLEEQLNKLGKEALNKHTRQNQVINKIGRVFGIENLDELLLGSRAATLKDVFGDPDNIDLDKVLDDPILNNYKKQLKNLRTGKTTESNPLAELIEDYKNAKGEMDDVIFDTNLRVKTNKDGSIEFFDTTESMRLFNSFLDKFNSTLPGKVLTKGIDIKSIKEAPTITYHLSGKRSIISKFDEGDDKITEKFRIAIDGTLFDVDKDDVGTLELGKELGQGYVTGMSHGTIPGVIKRWLGSGRTEPLASRNWFAEKLDLNQDGHSNLFNRIKQFWTKFDDDDWERNVIERVQEHLSSGRSVDEELEYLSKELNISKSEAMRRIHEDHALVNDLFKKQASSNVVSRDTIASLLETVNGIIDSAKENGIELDNHIVKSQRLLELIIEGDMESTFKYLSEESGNIRTLGLSNIIRNYMDDSDRTLKRLSIESNISKKIPIMDMELSETNVTNIVGILKNESLKEIFSDTGFLQQVLNVTDDIGGQQMSAIMGLYQWQAFENATLAGQDFSSKVASLFIGGGKFDQYLNLMTNNPDAKVDLIKDLEVMKADFGFLHKGNAGNANEFYRSEYDEYEFIPKSKWGLDLITGENKKTKIKAALREFNGGGDNLDDVSMLSVATQYMINRLSMGLEDSGLGLSYHSLSSPLKAITSIMTKRVLPVMMVYTAFDYLNDMSQDLTGVGITGAAANALANLDIAARKVLYNIGIGDYNLGQAIDNFEASSVIAEYWTGSTEFQTAEERREWYADGYSPVRKSRFWSFGSASEFRGGDITFFQPNYLRRIHSDYRDEWLYGGNKEKWAHSIIPTPTHPFSTIRYLMNPYWLEEKHIDDAPTPLTGKMFSEGTPWGAVLNPTIGRVIKPQIMLPETRKRLTGKGHDVKTIVKRINETIKARGGDADMSFFDKVGYVARGGKLKDLRDIDTSRNDDLLVINGTDIRNAKYIPYGSPTGNELIIRNGRVAGLNYTSTLSNVSEYQVPVFTPMEEDSAEYGGSYQYTSANPVLKALDNAGKSLANQVFAENEGIGYDIITAINNSIRSKGSAGRRMPVNSSSPDSSAEGTYVYTNLVNQYNTRMTDYYEDKFTPGMIDKSIAMDHIRDIKHSVKNLSGIYGFLGDTFFGSDEFTFRYENAGSYTSFTKGFWDAGIGGLGGGPMEIARRFFPSSDKSRVDYNPLRNNVADWLPDYLQVGNPFNKLTKGEMRLPGKGYESLNELHPDEYATDGYGAFDRFKILADVAPNSEEYKIWHNIVKHQTVPANPNLAEEVKEIEERTKRMRGSHEFYEYQYLHTNTKYEKGTVKELRDNGQIVLADGKILTMAGIKFNEQYGGELADFISPGQTITYRTTDDAINDHENGVIRNAAIYSGTENVNRALIDMGVAERDYMDTSSIGQLAVVSASQEFWGGVQELIAHARIPIIHNKLMHIETPLESFKSEQVYGANFQTWDHPIEGFVKPMMAETMGQSTLRRMLAAAYGDFHFNKVLKGSSGKLAKFASGLTLATLDPSAMLAGTVSWALRLGNGRTGSGNQVLGAWSLGAKYGNIIGTAAWGFANADNPIKAAGSFALAGMELFSKLDLGEWAYYKLGKTIDIKGAAAIGAGIGLGISALKNSRFDKEKMFGKWMPKKFKEKAELDEYFDRLEYIKYKGLYEAAATKADRYEKTNIRAIFKDIDKNKKRIQKLKDKKKKLLNRYNENDLKYRSKAAEIDKEIEALNQSGNQMFLGGKYTKAAVAYKKAMESTIYGLSEGATQDEILAAVPDQYKDYFQAFMEETDESERKKILKNLPSYLRRPLQAAWGEEMEDVSTNRKYFKSHKLPNMNWRGWKPNINLKHVKMKTIENEGMLLSDFGFYESEKAKAAYEIAPDIDNYDSKSPYAFSTTLRLGATMKGMGIRLSNMSIEKTSTPGFWLTADIKQSISDRTEYGTHSLSNAIHTLTGNFV